MSKWFNYPTAETLLQAARDLSVDDVVHVDSNLAKLLQPLEISGHRAGNRLAIHPMEGCDGELDGLPGELTIRRWERFGAGGCKLIWGEAVAVLDGARANPRQLWLHENSADAIVRLVERLRTKHRENWGVNACDDLLVGCQLTHSGRYSCCGPLIAMNDPSSDESRAQFLNDDDLRRVEDAYVAAAKLAVRAGFDFLDIKQCHRYLLSELLASHTRPGEFGGSFENRTRLVCNIIRRIRAEVSKTVLLATRFNMSDFVPFMKAPDGSSATRPFSIPYRWAFGVDPQNPLQVDLSEPKALVRMLIKEGVSLFNLSLGNPYTNPHFGRPFEMAPPDGYESPEHPLIGVARHFRLAAEMQREFPGVPMAGTGYSWLRHHFLACGAANVNAGRITFVGVGRGAFAYPDFVRDLHERGEIIPEKACIAVSSCTALMRAKANELGQFPSGCVPKDKLYQPIYRDAVAKRK